MHRIADPAQIQNGRRILILPLRSCKTAPCVTNTSVEHGFPNPLSLFSSFLSLSMFFSQFPSQMEIVCRVSSRLKSNSNFNFQFEAQVQFEVQLQSEAQLQFQFSCSSIASTPHPVHIQTDGRFLLFPCSFSAFPCLALPSIQTESRLPDASRQNPE